MEIKFFVLLVEAFQFFKFHENDAKYKKHKCKTDLNVTLWLEIPQITEKIC